MGNPNLKRVKVASVKELQRWISKQPDRDQSILLVTFSNPSSEKYVSRDQVLEVLEEHGWTAGRSSTQNINLTGHVIHKYTEED